jgi:hypothetical protein
MGPSRDLKDTYLPSRFKKVDVYALNTPLEQESQLAGLA